MLRLYHGAITLRHALFPGVHKRLGLNPKGISDAVDVVEVADDLRRIVDSAVVHTVGAEHIKVGGAHLLGGARQLFGVFTQGPIKG